MYGRRERAPGTVTWSSLSSKPQSSTNTESRLPVKFLRAGKPIRGILRPPEPSAGAVWALWYPLPRLTKGVVRQVSPIGAPFGHQGEWWSHPEHRASVTEACWLG